MCEQTEISYLDGEVVWVKLGSCWWPGEVVGADKLPPDVLPSFRKPPIAVVKFFQEDAYEYVKNLNCIYKYNCSRKNEFINKGLYMYRTKHGHMEKFPEDVIRAEKAVGGDITILTRDEFQETKKESYANLFGDPAKKTPLSIKKGRGRGRPSDSPTVHTPVRKINIDKPNYKVHILVQGSQNTPVQTASSETASTPSTSRAGSEPVEENKVNAEKPMFTPEKPLSTPDKPVSTPDNSVSTSEKPVSTPNKLVSTPKQSSTGIYSCHACPFTTMRMNVLIMHNKTHSVTFMPYTPTPIKKKVVKTPKSSPNATKTPKVRKPRLEKADKPLKKSLSQKRAAEDTPVAEVKKTKTDEEIKSSLLADWDIDEDSNDESSVLVAAPAESAAVAASEELPEAQVPIEPPASIPKSSEDFSIAEKPESSCDSKYEFCEDEDWPEEADVGRKIPRVKNPKRKEDTKSISLDDDDVAREVAELLNKTTVPDLPSAPEPLKVEENFPEPSVVKSPDKKIEVLPEVVNPPETKSNIDTQPPKTIFKTKTFFRSRHSRSQDAIGKYVAEQLNAERMDMSEDINGSEISSPETRISPPIVEPVKVARLAPKIQLKKMKAEAAQMREKERMADIFKDDFYTTCSSPTSLLATVSMPEQLVTKDNDVITSNQAKASTLEQIKEDLSNHTTQIEVEHLTKTDDVMPVKLQEPSTRNIQPDHAILNVALKSTVDPALEKDSLDENNSRKSKLTFPTNENGSTYNYDCSKHPQNNEDKMDVEHLLEDETLTIHGLPTLEISKDRSKEIPGKEQSIILPQITDIYEKSSGKNEEAIDKCNVGKINDVNDYIQFSDVRNANKSENTVDVIEPTALQTNQIEVTVKETSKSVETYMNESTASAVDALLSVSRDNDKVTKIISNDLPEDLFEDDNKDSSVKTINGFMGTIDSDNTENHLSVQQDIDTNAYESEPQDVVCETVTENDHKDTLYINENLITKPDQSTSDNKQNIETESILQSTETEVGELENVPSESDLVIAETLINLPSTTIQNKPSTGITVENPQFSGDSLLTIYNNSSVDVAENKIITADEACVQRNLEISSNHVADTDSLTTRFETEQEKSENLNAAQSLVQMSESIEHKVNVGEIKKTNKIEKPKSVGYKNQKELELIINTATVEQKLPLIAEKGTEGSNSKSVAIGTTSPKLLKILEESCSPKLSTPNILTKQVIHPGKDKILNFDVGKSGISNKSHSPKQKIIIRRSNTPHKNLLNNVTEVTTPDKIILSRSNNVPQDGSSVQTYTIQTAPDAPSDPNTIVIQQKVRKITKTPAKLPRIKPQTSIVTSIDASKVVKDSRNTEDAMFDINSMPIVLSDEILTPESIEKMPIVMSDGNIITNAQKTAKPKQTVLESEKIVINQVHQPAPKQTGKTILMNPVNEGNKVTTPNILSKSSKLRGTKMLVIDKTSGKQKLIMTKQATPEPPVKENKPQTSLIQQINQNPIAPEKFILIPSKPAPRPSRQKIVIDPQTGKAHLLVGRGPDSPLQIPENKPAPAKIVSTPSEAPGNTVMIITNAQGAQSRIVLKPEHEKILFPNKQPISQLKAITHKAPSNASSGKTVVTSVASVKSPARVVPKQKGAIITSKGQLIVGGRVATTTHNLAPMPEIRPALKRSIANEPKKIVQTTQKSTTEPLIFIQQKSGTMMQLTAAQFEHLQRTGQIIQKTVPPPMRENKIVLQKTINITPNETLVTPAPKPRVRKQVGDSPAPMKKLKQEIPIAPAPTPVPALCPISNTAASTVIPPTISTPSTASSSSYQLENFEELLPSTAIVRRLEPVIPQPEPPAQPAPPPPLSDGQLLAVPGEHFGGPPGSFYLCVEDNGTFTPIDNRPLVLENNQLVPMPEPIQTLVQQPERRDILEAALANSDVFHGETTRDEAPDFRDLNANVSVHCRVSETSTTLNQPIMTPVEVPTKVDSEPAVPSNLEDGLAVIGVTPHTVPTSLELPITVTDPRIAPKTTDPLSGNNYGTTLLPSPNTEMTFVTTEEVDVPVVGPISMPLLTDEESVGKSMPILTDDISERIVSSVESTIGSPSSIDVRDTETDDGSQWSRRLLTPSSDTSEISAEIPLQPKIQLSVSDIK